MKSLGLSIVEICNENNWILQISDEWKNGIHSDQYEFEIYTANTLFMALISNDSYRKTWYITNENDYPKVHLGSDCFYILRVIYMKDENDKIDFLLEFSIKLLEKYPEVIVETIEADYLTGMKEYTLKELYQIREKKFQNNWNAIK
jgi:hypothetical protein